MKRPKNISAGRADLAGAALAAALLGAALGLLLSNSRPPTAAPAGFACAGLTIVPAAANDLRRCANPERFLLGGRMDLNRATVSDLDLIPGIGIKTAAAVVGARARRGPFRSAEEAADQAGLSGPPRRVLLAFADARPGAAP